MSLQVLTSEEAKKKILHKLINKFPLKFRREITNMKFPDERRDVCAILAYCVDWPREPWWGIFLVWKDDGGCIHDVIIDCTYSGWDEWIKGNFYLNNIFVDGPESITIEYRRPRFDKRSGKTILKSYKRPLFWKSENFIQRCIYESFFINY
jgi:hypothetical protein